MSPPPCFLCLEVKTINILKLISPIPPSVNHYLGWRAILKNGKPLALSYETPEAKKYKKEFKQHVIEQVALQGWDMPVNKTQHFFADCMFYFARIDQDPNNYYKLAWDSITETQLVWADDNVVCERCNGILYDSANPRIEVEIRPVDYIGIFNNLSQLEQFESNCIQCNRYKNRKCSLLSKAIEGRIQPEISNGICKKFSNVKGASK